MTEADPIRFGHQATVSSANGPGSRLDEGVRVFSSRFRNALTQLERVQGAKLPGMTSVSWFLEGLRQDLPAEVN